ncbi:ATP-binding protein [Lacinutrix sp. Bg11-31]|uniref:ATP-binding protein n=1 Tax=Lacinutrix sp. Bg11-31 TaxID=2057808 RepID=UPI0012FE3706|nr:ATP-binding protein [Lacinutrix sp. Bg11-31]
MPKNLGVNSINLVLTEFKDVFNYNEQRLTGYVLDLSKIRKINVLGMLIVYKIIEYSVEKKCFQNPEIHYEELMEDKWAEFEFIPILNSYIKEVDSSQSFKNLKIQLTDKFILAPQPLLRNSDFTDKYLKNKFLPKIKQYYQGRDKVISMVFTCFSEILLNFWEHAVDDTKSIMIADGNKNYMEIACSDTGNGIISTLKKNPKYNGFSNTELISKCVNKNVTSKENTYHMGFGLWIIDQIVKEVKGRFHLFSEGVHYSNEYGKVKIKNTGFWQGTIVYIALPLNNAKSLCDIDRFKTKAMDNIKIDFL